MIKVGIIGATGYAGVELVRILLTHPDVELKKLSSVSYEGKALSEIYPALYQDCDDILASQQEVIDASDVVFASLPHGLSQGIAKQAVQAGKAFIDLGADFRLNDGEIYHKWYGCTFEDQALQDSAAYGLPELYRERIRAARLVANPGCYPTSVALGLYPALQGGLCSAEGLIVDSKSGATGAGRGLAQNTHFPDLNEGFAPYKVGAHRHTPEIEQTLSQIAGQAVRVTFVPHLLPINRGIVSTIYAKSCAPLEQIHRAYCAAYEQERFVRVLPLGQAANLKNVRMTNNCHISLHEDAHTGTLIVVSAIDNMVKGAAGQAVQNMNLLFGLPEDRGLNLIAPAM